MTATMEEAEVKKGSRRSKYRATDSVYEPSGDMLDEIGAGPKTAQEANAHGRDPGWRMGMARHMGVGQDRGGPPCSRTLPGAMRICGVGFKWSHAS